MPRMKRTTRIWVALGATVTGTGLVVALAAWTGARRDTDLADGSASVSRDFVHSAPTEAPELTFVDVAAEVGLTESHAPGARNRLLPEDTGSGLAWGDVDGDGDPDLYVVDFAAPNRLYLNQGDGTFQEAAEAAGVADEPGFGMGAAFADYDDDGDLDLYVTNRGPNRLFRNRGDGTFDEMSAAAGVDDPSWSTGAVWGDLDRDGHLDLYVANYLAFDDAAVRTLGSGSGHGAGRWTEVPYTLNPNAFDPQPNRFYRNRGDGTFEEVALPSGVSNPGGRSLAVTACDLDGDGWLDLYVNNDVSPNALFRNQGEDGLPGLFEDRSAAAGVADPRGSMGLSVTDLDGSETGGPDGLPDLFVSHWVAQENALYQAVRGAGGRLEYRDRSRNRRLAEVSIERVGWGSVFADLDLDGRSDLVVVNGSTLERPGQAEHLTPETMFLFWNEGDRFHDLAPQAGEATARPHNARGLAAADYDLDGDVDLAVSVNRGPPLLLRNDTPREHHGLAVRLEAPAAALHGARVEVETSVGRQVRWLGCDASFLSGHEPALLFGLGSEDIARSVTVTWADGTTSRLESVTAGSLVVAHPRAH